MRRRSFLELLAATTALGFSRTARAGTSKIKDITREAGGTTLRLSLDHAPFPAPGSEYSDATVFVFVPDAFRTEPAPEPRAPDAPYEERVPLVVHFHGHRTTAERAMVAHELREQLVDSKQNAILVVPQGPVMAADSSCGNLETPGGLSRLLDEVLSTLGREAVATLGAARIVRGARLGTVCLSAHSGGYHAAAACLRVGNVEINEVYLFDALYGEADTFRDWVIAGKGRRMRERHKLVSYYGPAATEAQSRWLRGELEKADVHCAYEEVEGTLSREQLSQGEAVFVRTQVAHSDITHEFNALRDCLYASGLPRHIRTAWFANKTDRRTLERRR